jgi:bis(5'-nucleosyl)-tetraphosphatase (symmetrical)
VAIYLVGDIQGCFDELQLLLASVDFDPSRDQLWPVGDLIGRGSKSLETLEYLYGVRDAVYPVLGNHDLHFLAIYFGIKKVKPSDKFYTLLADQRCAVYVEWLSKQPLARLLEESTLVCHAGLHPHWTVKQALRYSTEFQEYVKSEGLLALLNNMYGNEPSTWRKDLKGIERIRFIINAFTRMRYLKRDGELEFSCKKPLLEAPKDLIAWFDYPAKRQSKVIFGHWAALMGDSNSNSHIALDQGCVWGNKLSMLRYDDGRLFCQPAL